MTALKPELEGLEGLEGIGQLQVRLVRHRRLRDACRARAVRAGRPQHQRAQERAGVDARPAPEGPEALRQEAHADVGCRPVRHRLRQHQVLRALHREDGRHLGRPARPTSRPRTTSSASPRRRSSASSPVSRRSTSPRSSTTRSARTSSSRASSSSTPTPRCASTRTCSASTSPPSSRPATTSSPR